eukprot:GEZU01027221.1.p1 GENE.GEZU01027221.1~~GEZU01027221.1.p1  ORF type:complete len:190 (+),score=25.79 GEZU01027221.1:326-895(+)
MRLVISFESTEIKKEIYRQLLETYEWRITTIKQMIILRHQNNMVAEQQGEFGDCSITVEYEYDSASESLHHGDVVEVGLEEAESRRFQYASTLGSDGEALMDAVSEASDYSTVYYNRLQKEQGGPDEEFESASELHPDERARAIPTQTPETSLGGDLSSRQAQQDKRYSSWALVADEIFCLHASPEPTA